MSTPSNHGYTLTIIAFHADDICVFSYSRLYATEQEIIRFRAGDYTDSNYRRKPSNLSKVGVDMIVELEKILPWRGPRATGLVTNLVLRDSVSLGPSLLWECVSLV